MAVVGDVIKSISTRFVGLRPSITPANDFPVVYIPGDNGDVIIKNVDGQTMQGAALFLVTGLIKPESVGHDKNSVFYHTIKKALTDENNDLGPFLLRILRNHTRESSVIGVVGEVAVIKLLKQYGLKPKVATLEEDLYDDVDLFAGSLQIPIQVKTTTAPELLTSVFEQPAGWYYQSLLFLRSRIKAYFASLNADDEDRKINPSLFYQDLRAESSSFITICGKGQEIPLTWQRFFDKLAINQPYMPAIIQRMFTHVYRFEQLKKRNSRAIMVLVNVNDDIDWKRFRFSQRAEQYIAKRLLPIIEQL